MTEKRRWGKMKSQVQVVKAHDFDLYRCFNCRCNKMFPGYLYCLDCLNDAGVFPEGVKYLKVTITANYLP